MQMSEPVDGLLPRHLKQAAQWWVKLNDDKPSQRTFKAFCAWLRRNPLHQAAFDRVAATVRDIEALGAEARADGGALKAESANLQTEAAAIPADVAEQARRPQMPDARPLGLFAMAACATLAVVWAMAIAPTTYATPIGAERVVDLSDSTRATLNTNTKIEVLYSAAHRARIKLDQGEAAFAIAPRQSDPVRLEVGDLLVEAANGEVTARVDGDMVTLVVVSGDGATVRDLRLRDSSGVSQRLGVHQRLLLRGGVTLVSAVEPQEINRMLAWRLGWLEFNGQTLGTVASEVSRYTDVRIIVDDPALERLPVVANFHANDLREFLNYVNRPPLGLRVTSGEGYVRISRRVQEL